MSTHILIIDPDAAFASMMSQALRSLAGYRVTVATSGQDALARLDAADPVHMAILNRGVDDISPAALIDALRERIPDLPVLMIPPEGAAAPPELSAQGAVGKPPFLSELPRLVERTLGREYVAPAEATAPETAVEAAPAAETAQAVSETLTLPNVEWFAYEQRNRQVYNYPELHVAPEARTHLERALSQVSEALDFLPVLLTRSNQLMARVGGMNEREAKQLARSINRAWSTNGAKTGAREMVRFDEFLHPEAFDPFTVYSTVVVDGFFLSVAWRGRLALGRVRRQIRHAAHEIAPLLHAAEAAI